MRPRSFAALFLTLAFAAAAARAFEACAPEAQGVPSRAVQDWISTVERDIDALHGFVLVRHGKIIAEGWWSPYERERPHMLYSLSKSFTSTAVGIAADEGRLSLDDKVVSFFPDKLPEAPSENLRRMRVRDLLCMGTGHQDDTFPALKAAPDGDWARLFLARPVQHEPGTFFRYNTGATYMLAAILRQATGEDLLDYLTPRLFAPLDIRNPTWETGPQGVRTGGYGLKVTTRDIAALGQLYLQKGLWNGRQLLSSNWVAQATAKQIANGDNPSSDWAQGYGFQFWRCRHNAFRGDGAFGQYCLVLPDQDAVLAINSGLGNMQQVLDTVWSGLLPAMRPEALPADPAAHAALTAKLAALTLPPVAGDAAPAAGALGQTFTFGDNPKALRALALRPEGEGFALELQNAHGAQRVVCGRGRWVPGELTFEPALKRSIDTTNGRQPVAASGAWTAPDRYVAQIVFRESPFRLTLTLHFQGDRLELGLEQNVSFDPRTWSLTGRAAPQP